MRAASAAVHLDVPYPGATGPRQALDLFLPASAGPNSPLLVFIHGAARLTIACKALSHACSTGPSDLLVDQQEAHGDPVRSPLVSPSPLLFNELTASSRMRRIQR